MKEYMEQIMYSHKWFKTLYTTIEKKIKRLRMKNSKWIDIIQKQITDNEETFEANSIKDFLNNERKGVLQKRRFTKGILESLKSPIH